MANNIEKEMDAAMPCKFSGKEPDGCEMLATLVELYAHQLGVNIRYEIIDVNTGEVSYRGDSEQHSIIGRRGFRKQ